MGQQYTVLQTKRKIRKYDYQYQKTLAYYFSS